MAISAKQAKEFEKEKCEAPFSQSELEKIKEVEDYIDKSIVDSKDCTLVTVHLQSTTFDKEPVQRRGKMVKELHERYEMAGWELKTIIDDGLDGPNRSGPDCLMLKAK